MQPPCTGRRVPIVLVALVLAALGVVAPPSASPAHAASSIEPGAVDRGSLAIEARYDVRATLRMATGTMTVVERIAITNRSGGPIDRLDLNTVLARIGSLRITRASVDGVAVAPVVDDQTIRLPLGGVLPDGASASVALRFTARAATRLDGSRWLFARVDGSWSAYRWLPWIGAARRFDRPNHGDPFMTVSSPFVRLAIRSDRPVRLATNGRRVAVDGLSQVFEAVDVRDFTFVADARFGAASRLVGNTKVVVFARSAERRAALLRHASRALTRLERLLGPYPWRRLTVAETAGGYAVESPGGLWIPRGVAAGRLPWLVAHEVAHQWFYGLVGSDQARQPFADEAPADFLARHVTGTQRASRCDRDDLDRAIYRYSAACYFEVVYVQGARVLDGIRRRAGDTAFFGALREYLAARRHGFGSTAELLAALDVVDPADLMIRLRPRFPRIL